MNGSAPTLGEDWRAALRALEPGWDSYMARPIAEAAIAKVEKFLVVPRTDGGIQLEICRNGFDVEIEIGPDGLVQYALVIR